MKENLIKIICDAFSGGVGLGSGIGLWQAQAIDDYKTEKVVKAREKDEKSDWQKIPWQVFVSCETSLSFFDAEGMRFYLPGFFIADLRGTAFAHDLFLNFSEKERFALLDDHQRIAALQYLLYQKEKLQKEKYFDENDYHFQQLLEIIENWRQ